MNSPAHIWVISELYYPEETSTGYYLTLIAEGLAQRARVSVLCAQPTYAKRGNIAPATETHKNVNIHRCCRAWFSQHHLIGRVLNSLFISLNIFVNALRRVRKNDQVLVVTNPPFMPYVIWWACRLRGARCLLLVHDMYPDVLAATGIMRAESLMYRWLGKVSLCLFRSVDALVVIGRDMFRRLAEKDAILARKMVVITNWADLEEIRPIPREERRLARSLGIIDKFIILYMGNVGRTHGTDDLIAAAKALTNNSICFLVIASGSGLEKFQRQVEESGLGNFMFLPRQPREDLAACLGTCDLALISLKRGMAGVSVPSRLYNILAAGRPVLAVVEEGAEPALVVREEDIGFVVAPGAPEELAGAILKAKANPQQLAVLGARARRAAEQKYTCQAKIEQFFRLFGLELAKCKRADSVLAVASLKG